MSMVKDLQWKESSSGKRRNRRGVENVNDILKKAEADSLARSIRDTLENRLAILVQVIPKHFKHINTTLYSLRVAVDPEVFAHVFGVSVEPASISKIFTRSL